MMARIETLSAYRCTFSYLQRNNPLKEELQLTPVRLSQINLKKSRPAVLRKSPGAEAQNLICA